MSVLKENLKNEKFKFCPQCGLEINLVIEELSERKKSDLDLINEKDWLLP